MMKLTNMYLHVFICYLIFGYINIAASIDDTNDDSVSLNFEDNIDDRFSSFSKFNTRLSRQSNQQIQSSRTISSLQYQRLVDYPNDYPYYTLKVHYKRGPTQDYVMTSVPMCFVLQSQFQYTTILFTNENGFIVGVQITTQNSTCDQTKLKLLEKTNEYTYKVTMGFHLNDMGPQPETQQFLEKLKRQQEAKLNANENDNRPFVLKYWKYIVPIVIMFALQALFTNEPAGAGGSGENSGGQ